MSRYYNNADALNALKYISGTKLDERIIRADLDPGYKDGRQYGRGKSGGQVRDEFRQDYDSGRGMSGLCFLLGMADSTQVVGVTQKSEKKSRGKRGRGIKRICIRKITSMACVMLQEADREEKRVIRGSEGRGKMKMMSTECYRSFPVSLHSPHAESKETSIIYERETKDKR